VSEEIKRLAWAIAARERSQRLLLALYDFGQQNSELTERPKTEVFSLLVGVAFSLWRAAFLTDMPTREWPEALRDARKLLKTVLSTNAIGFSTEHNLQGWMGGYYLQNVKLRLQDAQRRQIESGQARPEDFARVEGISLMGTDPHQTWMLFCEEAERLARQLGCR
jgi:hypothetical protein